MLNVSKDRVIVNSDGLALLVTVPFVVKSTMALSWLLSRGLSATAELLVHCYF